MEQGPRRPKALERVALKKSGAAGQEPSESKHGGCLRWRENREDSIPEGKSGEADWEPKESPEFVPVGLESPEPRDEKWFGG